MEQGAGYVTITGDGLAVEGPCLVCGLILQPNANADYCTVYDGLDAVSGKEFLVIDTSTIITRELLFPCPVRFNHGVYIDGLDSAVKTTVIFQNVE